MNMKEHPILFSIPMVKAIREDRKTITRRIINPQPAFPFNTMNLWVDFIGRIHAGEKYIPLQTTATNMNCPYGSVGDILWVRETHYAFGKWRRDGKTKTGKQSWKFSRMLNYDFKYSDNPPEKVCTKKGQVGYFKRNSIFMPRVACRTTLLVGDVLVSRLHDMTEADAQDEGFSYYRDNPFRNNKYRYKAYPNGYRVCFGPLVSEFANLWDKINGKKFAFDSNPFVFVIKFMRL